MVGPRLDGRPQVILDPLRDLTRDIHQNLGGDLWGTRVRQHKRRGRKKKKKNEKDENDAVDPYHSGRKYSDR